MPIVNLFTSFESAFDITNPDKGYKPDERKDMWRTYRDLVKLTGQYRTSAQKQQSVERIKLADQQIKYHASLSDFAASMENIRGMDRRAAATVMQREYASIRRAQTALDKSGRVYNDGVMMAARRESGMKAPGAGTLDAKRTGWTYLLGGYTEDPTMKQMTLADPQMLVSAEMYFGKIEDVFEKGSAGYHIATDFKRRAEEQKIHRINVENDIIAGGKIFQSTIDRMFEQAKTDDSPVSDEQLMTIRGDMLKVRGTMAQAAGTTPEEARAMIAQQVDEDAWYEQQIGRADKLWSELQGGEATSWREQRGEILSDPSFLEWAKDNGFDNLGDATSTEIKDSEGNVIGRKLENYTEGRDDLKAILRYQYQLMHPNRHGPLSVNRGRTNEYVSLRIKATPENAERMRLPDGRFAYATQDDGSMFLFDENQVREIEAARTPKVFLFDDEVGVDDAGSEVYQTYAQERDSQGNVVNVYRYDDETEEWAAVSSDERASIDAAAAAASAESPEGKEWGWAPALKTRANFGEDGEELPSTVERYLTADDLWNAPVGGGVAEADITGASPGDVFTFDEIPDVTFTDDLSEIDLSQVPGIEVYGQRQRYHAKTFLDKGKGTVGIWTQHGLQFFTPDEIVDMVVEQGPATTQISDVANRRIGLRSEAKAREIAATEAPEDHAVTDVLGVKRVDMGRRAKNVWDKVEAGITARILGPGEALPLKERMKQRQEQRQAEIARAAEEAPVVAEAARKDAEMAAYFAEQERTKVAELRKARREDRQAVTPEEMRDAREERREARRYARATGRVAGKAEREAAIATTRAGVPGPLPSDIAGAFDVKPWGELSAKMQDYINKLSENPELWTKFDATTDELVQRKEDLRAWLVVGGQSSEERARVEEEMRVIDGKLTKLHTMAIYAEKFGGERLQQQLQQLPPGEAAEDREEVAGALQTIEDTDAATAKTRAKAQAQRDATEAKRAADAADVDVDVDVDEDRLGTSEIDPSIDEVSDQSQKELDDWLKKTKEERAAELARRLGFSESEPEDTVEDVQAKLNNLIKGLPPLGQGLISFEEFEQFAKERYRLEELEKELSLGTSVVSEAEIEASLAAAAERKEEEARVKPEAQGPNFGVIGAYIEAHGGNIADYDFYTDMAGEGARAYLKDTEVASSLKRTYPTASELNYRGGAPEGWEGTLTDEQVSAAHTARKAEDAAEPVVEPVVEPTTKPVAEPKPKPKPKPTSEAEGEIEGLRTRLEEFKTLRGLMGKVKDDRKEPATADEGVEIETPAPEARRFRGGKAKQAATTLLSRFKKPKERGEEFVPSVADAEGRKPPKPPKEEVEEDKEDIHV